jgi:signal transduction histidine kinase
MKNRRAPSTLHLTWVLLVALALLNAASLWGIWATRRGARGAAEHDFELRTTVLARSVEAELASLRADFLFLARSPPLTGLLGSLESPDPLVRRWSRLDAEGTLLLFLEAHPEVRCLAIEEAEGRALVIAGWTGEAPVIFPPMTKPGILTSWFQGRWPTDPRQPEGPSLHAYLDRRRLLEAVVPDARGTLSLEIAPAASDAAEGAGLVAAVPVADAAWEPPVDWLLTAREDEGQLLRSVEAVTGLYGTTVAVNVAVMSLGLLLGVVAFRNLRRAARLEAERQQQERVRELERQLMHSERLASVGRLAAGLAHEINNPLEGVSNYLGLLDEDLAAARLEGSRELLALAEEGVGRAAEVIRQVLAYSDPGRGAVARLDLREALQRSVDFVRRNPDHRGVDIDVAMPTEPLTVEGNPVTLGQVFLNLLLNASEAQSGVGRLELTAAADDGSAVVRVADRGAGIAPQDLERIFEPFFSTKESTGLGLAVSQGIVESHGGTLSAANRDGGGAVLEVRLPLANEEEP